MSENIQDQNGVQGTARPTNTDKLPQPNPFRAKTWNMTQQARLMKREPKKAERLQAEAVAEGEHHAPYLNRSAFYRAHGF